MAAMTRMKATVYLPRSSGGRVLLSVENGSRVLSRRWVRLSGKEETASKLQVTKDMAPNFYVHATLLQPHAQTVNDLPIRMYVKPYWTRRPRENVSVTW